MDARVLEIEHDTAKTVCAERSVTSAIVSTIKKKQNLREAHHIEDSDTVLKEVTCLWSTIECAKRKTAEDVRTINDEHISRYFDEKRKLKRKHAKAIFNKHTFITKVRRVLTERTVNAQELEKELKQDDWTATKKCDIYKQLYGQSNQKAGNLTQQVQDLRDELEGIRDKANDEVDNLNSLLNVDVANKETL